MSESARWGAVEETRVRRSEEEGEQDEADDDHDYVVRGERRQRRG